MTNKEKLMQVFGLCEGKENVLYSKEHQEKISKKTEEITKLFLELAELQQTDLVNVVDMYHNLIMHGKYDVLK